jgi:prefoldin alpha subunit
VQGRSPNKAVSIPVNTEPLAGKPLLVPLTTSLYVPGTLADSEKVIVDVGTGYYVEKVQRSVTSETCVY